MSGQFENDSLNPMVEHIMLVDALKDVWAEHPEETAVCRLTTRGESVEVLSGFVRPYPDPVDGSTIYEDLRVTLVCRSSNDKSTVEVICSDQPTFSYSYALEVSKEELSQLEHSPTSGERAWRASNTRHRLGHTVFLAELAELASDELGLGSLINGSDIADIE